MTFLLRQLQWFGIAFPGRCPCEENVKSPQSGRGDLGFEAVLIFGAAAIGLKAPDVDAPTRDDSPPGTPLSTGSVEFESEVPLNPAYFGSGI